MLSCALPGIRHTSGESRTVIFSQRAPNVVREGAYVFVPDGSVNSELLNIIRRPFVLYLQRCSSYTLVHLMGHGSTHRVELIFF